MPTSNGNAPEKEFPESTKLCSPRALKRSEDNPPNNLLFLKFKCLSSDNDPREEERKPESFFLGMVRETTVCSLHVIPFHEQGVSSEWFQLLSDPSGSSVMEFLNESRATPSSFRELTTTTRLQQLHRININKAEKANISKKNDNDPRNVTVGNPLNKE